MLMTLPFKIESKRNTSLQSASKVSMSVSNGKNFLRRKFLPLETDMLTFEADCKDVFRFDSILKGSVISILKCYRFSCDFFETIVTGHISSVYISPTFIYAIWIIIWQWVKFHFFMKFFILFCNIWSVVSAVVIYYDDFSI